MNQYLKTILCGVLFILLSRVLPAEGPGSTSSNFLKAGQGVRAIAMADTYVALGDGLDALNWNPAGLVQLETMTANFAHTFWFQDLGAEYLAFGMPLDRLGAVAGGVTIFHSGPVTETLETATGEYGGEGGQISPVSFALVGGYSQKLAHLVPLTDAFLKNVLVGANLRLVTESLQDTAIFGGAVDLAVLWKETKEIKNTAVTSANKLTLAEVMEHAIRDQGWRLGLVAQNLGLTTDKALPINLKVGVGYVAQDLFTPMGKGTLAADITIPNDNNISVSFGGEFAHQTDYAVVAVRLGYKVGPTIKDLDALAGLTTGLGITVTSHFLRYQVDYAFVPYGELGLTHRLSFTLSFLPSYDPLAKESINTGTGAGQPDSTTNSRQLDKHQPSL